MNAVLNSGIADPLHCQSGSYTAWTRVKTGEGIPGVCTPLNGSWRDETQERTICVAYFDMGGGNRLRRDRLRRAL